MAGNANSGKRKEKQFFDALNFTLKNGKTPTARLNRIAEQLVQAAESGEQWAIKEVADRLDGKPAQTVDATIEQVDSFASLTIEQLAARTADTLRRIEEAASGNAVADSEPQQHSEVRTVN